MGDDGPQSKADLAGEIAKLREKNSELRAQSSELREKMSVLENKIEAMARTIAELEKKLGHNSQNSSMPPSSDTFVRPAKMESPSRKARRAMGRKPGKQPGAPGAHLAQVEDPDKVVPHLPQSCKCCGSELSGAELVDKSCARSSRSLPRASSSPSTASTSCGVAVASSTRASSLPRHVDR